jgi:peptide-methionine (R)-S-oxide reductase
MSVRYCRSEEALARLTPEQRRVTQREGTERLFTGEHLNNKAAGVYVDLASGEPLFASSDKFESGTGWPSFTRPILRDNVVEKTDLSHGMRRVEARSKHGGSHLGHVFPDGPRDAGGMRYCINSAALRFVPLKAMEAERYGDLLHLFDNAGKETAR